MSPKKKQILLHKKNNQGLSVSALAVHGSTKGGRLVAEAVVRQTRAEAFVASLRQEIRKAV